MQTTIAKWGNSLALRLPRSMAADAGLIEGTPVDLRLDGDRLVVTAARPRYNLSELLERLQPEHGHAEIEWAAPVGEEAW